MCVHIFRSSSIDAKHASCSFCLIWHSTAVTHKIYIIWSTATQTHTRTHSNAHLFILLISPWFAIGIQFAVQTKCVVLSQERKGETKPKQMPKYSPHFNENHFSALVHSIITLTHSCQLFFCICHLNWEGIRDVECLLCPHSGNRLISETNQFFVQRRTYTRLQARTVNDYFEHAEHFIMFRENSSVPQFCKIYWWMDHPGWWIINIKIWFTRISKNTVLVSSFPQFVK